MTLNAQRIGQALAAIGMVALLAATGSAHAKLEKSDPADKATLATAPVHVELWFNEAPDVKTSKIELKGAAGLVKLGPVHSMAKNTLMADITGTMADGKYTISWQTTGDDGHVLKGDILFTLAKKK